MKVLCKKEHKWLDIEFHPGNMYDGEVEDFTYRRWFRIYNKNIPSWFSFDVLNDYFYSPEETKNILRTELIDKMLYGKN